MFSHPCLYAGNFNCHHADCSLHCFDEKICRLCCCLIHLMWMWLTRAFVTPLRKQPKRLSRMGIKVTMFLVGMQTVSPSIKPFCSHLRETTQVWLLQPCLPSLTGNRGINDLRQFGALTSHILIKKHGVF